MSTKPNKNKRFSIEQLSGSICVAIIVGGSIISGGALGSYIDVPTTILTFGTAFFILLFMFGKDLFYFLKESLLVLLGKSIQPNALYAEIASTAGKTVIQTGAIGTMIGLINIASNLEDYSILLGTLAVASLTLFYGIVASFLVFTPLKRVFSHGTAQSDKPGNSLLMIAASVVITFAGGVILCFLLFLLIYQFTGTSSTHRNYNSGNAKISVCDNHSQVIFKDIKTNISDSTGLYICSADIVFELDRIGIQYFFESKTPYNNQGMQARIESTIGTVISRQTVKSLLTPQGKEALAEEIKQAVYGLIEKRTEGKIKSVFFSRILIQPVK